jgi:hypothetical protein
MKHTGTIGIASGCASRPRAPSSSPYKVKNFHFCISFIPAEAERDENEKVVRDSNNFPVLKVPRQCPFFFLVEEYLS